MYKTFKTILSVVIALACSFAGYSDAAVPSITRKGFMKAIESKGAEPTPDRYDLGQYRNPLTAKDPSTGAPVDIDEYAEILDIFYSHETPYAKDFDTKVIIEIYYIGDNINIRIADANNPKRSFSFVGELELAGNNTGVYSIDIYEGSWMVVSKEGIYIYSKHLDGDDDVDYSYIIKYLADSIEQSEAPDRVKNTVKPKPEKRHEANLPPSTAGYEWSDSSSVDTTQPPSAISYTLPTLLTTVADYGKYGENMSEIINNFKSAGYKYDYHNNYLTVAFCTPDCGMPEDKKNDVDVIIDDLPASYSQMIVQYSLDNKGQNILLYIFWFEDAKTSDRLSTDFLKKLIAKLNGLGYKFDSSAAKLYDAQISRTSKYGPVITWRTQYKNKSDNIIYGVCLNVVP